MQIDLVPELPPFGVYQNIVRAVDVFTGNLFVNPTMTQDAKMVGRVVTDIMTKRANLLTTITSDKRAAFVSHLIRDVANVLGTTLEHATSKNARTIGMLERTHTPLNRNT